MRYTIIVPGSAQSMNVSLRAHWAVRNRANHAWYDAVAVAALGLSIPRPAFVSAIVEIETRYVVRQRGKRWMDADAIVKPTLDALVRCGILHDDRPPHLAETRLRARPHTHDEVVICVREAE